MRKLLLFTLLSVVGITASSQDKLSQDRNAIKALAGFYEVTFNYAETFSPDDNYKFYPRYESHGSEWVVVVEETPTKIVLQHILVLGKNQAMKHWREDWTYEDPTTLVYDKDNAWRKVTATAAQVKGTWTQKVFQVDDSPRYEGRGTWMHVGGRHQWQDETDSPLPRREHTKRSDYNVMRRLNRIYFTENGWMFEQDNKKIVRTSTGDKLIAKEKGEEEFIKIDPAYFKEAEKWWAAQGTFWKGVRDVWSEVFAKNIHVKVNVTVNNKPLYELLFAMADQSVAEKWSAEKSKAEAAAVISTYLDKGAW